MTKRLTKTIWYGSEVDSNGNPILPSANGGLDGLNYGELFLHLSNGKATLWTLSSNGNIVEIAGGSSSVDLSSYLLKSIWDKVFEIRTDSNGTEYIFGKLPVVTQYGITMYGLDENLDIPSIYAGIPVDGTTITKREDGTLMVNPNIELGGASNWDELEGKPSWITDSKPKYSYNEIEGAPDLSKYALNEDIEKLVTLNTDQIISGYKNFEKGLAINGLSITNTKDDIIYLDANLVIRGGLVIYADDTVDVPNLIDSLPKASYEVPGLAAFDSTYFVVDINGKVTLIPDNVGLNETELHNYLTSNGYATQTWVTSKNYATIGALNAVEDKIDSFLEGSDTDTIINKWKELESFLSGLNESDNLATILLTKADKTYVDGNFVTLTTTQPILGEKDFTGGLKVNGSPIYYDTEKKYWKFEGDLLVTGGVTMYGNDSEFIPSTIMDAIKTDGVTIRVNTTTKNLEVIGNLNGATTIGQLQNVGTWADSVADVDRIMYQQAGSSNWVAKSLSSIGGGGGSFSGGVITGSGYDVLVVNRTDRNRPTIGFQYNGSLYGYLGFSNADYPVFISSFGDAHQLLHSGNYSSYALPLTGGTITNSSYAPLVVHRNNTGYSAAIKYTNDSDGLLGYVGINGSNSSNSLQPYFEDASGNNNKIWHSGNDGSGSGLDADLLDGQHGSWYQGNIHSFERVNYTSSLVHDANVAINGMLYNYSSSAYWRNTPDMSYGQILTLKSYGSNELMGQLAWDIRHGESDTTRYLWWRAIQDESTISNGKWHQIAFTDSNVASATKLQTARTIWGQSFDGSGDVNGLIQSTTNTGGVDVGLDANGISYRLFFGVGSGDVNRGIYDRTNGGWWIYRDNTTNTLIPQGNVGLGTANPNSKLQILQSEWANGITIDRDASHAGAGINVCSKGKKLGEFGINGDMFFQVALSSSYGSNAILKFQVDNSGNVLVYGGITMYSDQRKKTILNHVELSLKQIAEAPLVEHFYNSDDKRTTHVGSIAQYWASMNDWFCKLDNEGYYTMEIQNCALASAISIARELDRYESKTDKTINKLKKKIALLEEEVEQLRSRL